VSYPQNTSSKSVLNNQEMFRLNTPLDSNGDIYEIDTSIKAIAIGPESDIQNARVWYPSAQNANGIETALVSVDDPFVGRMDALMSEEYPQLGSKRRILVASDDIGPVLPGMPRVESEGASDLIVWHKPSIDLLCYHQEPRFLPSTRSERQWQQAVTIYDNGGGDGISWYYFPVYRRKYFHVRFANPAGLTDYDFLLEGFTFHRSYRQIADGEYPSSNFDTIITWTAIANTFYGGEHIYYADRVPDISSPRAYPMGYFDYIRLAIRGDAIDGGSETTRLSFDVIATDWA